MSLIEKTKTALDESRMLMLGAQILLGFQFQAPFQDAFESLGTHEKTIEVTVLCIMVLVIGLLIAPSARHRIVEHGNATIGINRFITQIAFVTLLPFSIALALDVYIAGTRFANIWSGVLFGVLTFLVALALWYGPLAVKTQQQGNSMTTSDTKTPTAAKIDYVLTEARVVLPGAQALLGFQFAIVFTRAFMELPQHLKWAHGTAIGLITIATILLMTTATYHRVVYGGSDAPGFYKVASRLLLSATVFLALGLSADIYLVVSKISGSPVLSMALALTSAALLLGLWHLWPWWLSSVQKRTMGDPQSDRSFPTSR